MMSLMWQPLAQDLADRVRWDLLAVLDGLDPILLDAEPEAGTNSIGWILWHTCRSTDRAISELVDTGQLWTAQGWHARFGRELDPHETGYRHTALEVATFRSPAPEVLRGYHLAVMQRVDGYLEAAGDDELVRRVTSPTWGDTLIARRRLTALLVDALEHVGQAALLRGTLERRVRSGAPAGVGRVDDDEESYGHG